MVNYYIIFVRALKFILTGNKGSYFNSVISKAALLQLSGLGG